MSHNLFTYSLSKLHALSLIHIYPIVAHEFLGSSLDGKDVWVVDDMISSGGSMIDVARELKKRNAGRIFVIATFGLFTNGLEKFEKAVEDGLIYNCLLYTSRCV